MGRVQHLQAADYLRAFSQTFRQLRIHLLCAISPGPSAASGPGLRPLPRCGYKRRHTHRNIAHQRGGVDQRMAVQSRLQRRRAPGPLLGFRPELGFPHLQLGPHGCRRLRMVESALPQHGQIFRRLPHRPYPRLLQNMGNTYVKHPWAARNIQSCAPLFPRRAEGALRLHHRPRTALHALYNRQGS